jgi:hypothetical protein
MSVRDVVTGSPFQQMIDLSAEPKVERLNDSSDRPEWVWIDHRRWHHNLSAFARDDRLRNAAARSFLPSPRIVFVGELG